MAFLHGALQRGGSSRDLFGHWHDETRLSSWEKEEDQLGGRLAHASFRRLMRKAHGPASTFFLDNQQTRGMLYRNTKAHWQLHWFLKTRAKVWGDPVKSSRGGIAEGDDAQSFSSTFRGAAGRPSTVRKRIWWAMEHSKGWNLLLMVIIIFSAVSDVVETELVPPIDPATTTTILIIEWACMLFFTAELAVRVGCCPSRVRFLYNGMNWLDIFAVVPWWVVQGVIRIVDDAGGGESAGAGSLNESASGDGGAGTTSTPYYTRLGDLTAMVRLLKLVRMLRIFRLSAYSAPVRIFFLTIHESRVPILSLTFCLVILLLTFGSLIFMVEDVANNPRELYAGQACGADCFASVPRTLYFTTMTLSGVGYGDTVPATLGGKLMTSACMTAGLICIAMPVVVFAENLRRFYHAHEQCVNRLQSIQVGTQPIALEHVAHWLDAQVESGRLKAAQDGDGNAVGERSSLGEASMKRRGVAKGSANWPLAALDLNKLFETYDSESKGYLAAEEALLMMADINEFYEPDGTAKLNATLDAMHATVAQISQSIATLETVAFGRPYAEKQLARQVDCVRDAEPPQAFTWEWFQSIRKVWHETVSRKGLPARWVPPEDSQRPTTSPAKMGGPRQPRLSASLTMRRIRVPVALDTED